jgi:hypothetical protein
MTLKEKKSLIFVQCCFALGMTIQHLVTHPGKSQGVPKRVWSAWVEPIVNGFRTRTKLSTCGIVGTYRKSLVPVHEISIQWEGGTWGKTKAL